MSTPDGRRHSFSEKLLMAHVARQFMEKQKELGARQAARELRVSLASFYNYVAGTDLPRPEVITRAHKIWGIKWPSWIDTSEVVRTQNVRTPEQLVFAFLEAVRQGDVEVVQVTPLGQSALQVNLRIHFLTTRARSAPQRS